ncbi:MAG: hypothetical protein FIA95_14085 [Gemmatimonadetes bacterium]|nr:hypothetical protein [Gemmatimonadota bacterium]
MSTSSTARVLLLAALAPALLSGCSFTTSGELQSYAGEWCTLRGVGSSGLPRTADRYVGLRLFDEGGVLTGTGTTKRPGSDVLHQSRFLGSKEEERAVLEVTDLDPEATDKGPVFTLVLRVAGDRDLEGTISGEAGMSGPITLVRLGPRCFYQ